MSSISLIDMVFNVTAVHVNASQSETASVHASLTVSTVWKGKTFSKVPYINLPQISPLFKAALIVHRYHLRSWN